MENTATPRQRWALYCITHKDYRNETLSKEEAARLIKELGDLNYKKKSKRSIKTELLEYLKENINELYSAVESEMQLKSVVETDSLNDNKKRYLFIGGGCGITYLKYRKNNKTAEEIDKYAHQYRNEDIMYMLIDMLPSKTYKYLKDVGCPFEAIWHQMQNLQCIYYHFVKKFAKEKYGIEMEIVSHLD